MLSMNVKLSIKIKRKIPLLILLICFLLQNCSTILLETTSGISKIVPVTCNNSRAKVFLDGRFLGYTPLNLKLKKSNSLIRIEREGYISQEIRITRRISPMIFLSAAGNLFWSGVGALLGMLILDILTPSSHHFENLNDPKEEELYMMIAGAIIGWGGGVAVDFFSSANYRLHPKNLEITLLEKKSKSLPECKILNWDQFKIIKWIRIKCK